MKTKKILYMLISFSLLGLSSCDAMAPTPTETSETAAVLPTTTQIPTETPTPFLTPTIAPTSSPTSISCSELLSPENNATLPKTGKIHFSWSTFPTATLYRLEIVPPIGQVIVFNTKKTSRDQYIEAIWMGGNFQWQVSVLDSAGNKVCMSNKFTFDKPEYAPPPPPSGGKTQTGDACHPGVIVSYDKENHLLIRQEANGYVKTHLGTMIVVLHFGKAEHVAAIKFYFVKTMFLKTESTLPVA